MGDVVLLGGRCATTNIVYHALARSFSIDRVVIEEPVRRRVFLRNRVRRLGVRTVVGQLAFVGGLVPVLTRTSRRRVAAIEVEYGMDRSAIPDSVVDRVASANDSAAIELLLGRRPSVLVIHGTRILSKELLRRLGCPVINIHAGITPLFRGVHGAYWALATGDRERCGVTVHLVDPGIDTGGVLYQAPIKPSTGDNYVTYPYLQLGVGLPLLERAVGDARAGGLRVVPSPEGASRLWTHPTLGQYLKNRILRGVR